MNLVLNLTLDPNRNQLGASGLRLRLQLGAEDWFKVPMRDSDIVKAPQEPEPIRWGEATDEPSGFACADKLRCRPTNGFKVPMRDKLLVIKAPQDRQP